MLKNIIILIFRCLYYLLYHQFAWTYDYVAAFVSLGRWNSWVQHTLPFLTGQLILEIGFGPGHLLSSAMRSNIKIIGLDESKQMARRASKKIKSLGYIPPILRGNVYSLPFPGNNFNQVVCTFPSEYIFNSQAISEIYRVLSPGGQLIILPFAWIKGTLWYEILASRIFDFDMFTLNWYEKYCSVISQEGFVVAITQINDGRSTMAFIIATKLDNSKTDQMEKLYC